MIGSKTKTNFTSQETPMIVDLIRQHLIDVDLTEVITIQPQNCSSFKQLMAICKQNMTVTKSMEDCLAVGIATHIAVTLEGDPLWIYLVGAPSSGKSTICELLAADEIHTRPLSKFTGLVSGSRQGTHLIPMLQGKCVIVKDGTLLLESTPQQLANVYGELRDIFDGSLNAEYRNGVSASFSNISFGMIIGITERIYSLNMAALGERFLHCRLESNRAIECLRNNKAIESVFSSISRNSMEGNDAGDQRSFPLQKSYMAGFLLHLHSKLRNEDILRPKHTQQDRELIQALGDVIACSRAQAPRVKEFSSSELLYDAAPEQSTRVVKQLSRLAVCLCYVLGTDTINDDIKRLLTKVALDTSFSRQHNIIRTVALSDSGMSRTNISAQTNIALETITRRIDDLISLGIFISEESRGLRKSVPVLHCTDWVKDAFRKVHNVSSVSDSTSDTSTAEHREYRHSQPAKRPIKRTLPHPRKR
jgi:hypothetical protein